MLGSAAVQSHAAVQSRCWAARPAPQGLLQPHNDHRDLSHHMLARIPVIEASVGGPEGGVVLARAGDVHQDARRRNVRGGGWDQWRLGVGGGFHDRQGL